jgi:hypothetical protein
MYFEKYIIILFWVRATTFQLHLLFFTSNSLQTVWLHITFLHSCEIPPFFLFPLEKIERRSFSFLSWTSSYSFTACIHLTLQCILPFSVSLQESEQKNQRVLFIFCTFLTTPFLLLSTHECMRACDQRITI